MDSRGKDVVVEKPAVIDHCKQRSKGELKKGRIVTVYVVQVVTGRCRQTVTVGASVGRSAKRRY